jgi:hypothetical protein
LTSGSKPANFLFVNQLSFKTMAHQFSSGVFFNSQPAWHKLGTVLDGTQPAREAFATANADWSTISTPVLIPLAFPFLATKPSLAATLATCFPFKAKAIPLFKTSN